MRVGRRPINNCPINNFTHANLVVLSFSRVAAARRIPIFSPALLPSPTRLPYAWVSLSALTTLTEFFGEPQKESGTAATAALNKVKGLGAAVVPSLHSGRQEPPHARQPRARE